MAEVACERLTKRFGEHVALAEVSCRVGSAEVLFVLGPSGAGKTTLLNCIAGLARPEDGVIRIDQRVVTDARTNAPPHERGIAFVFARPTLWPHLTVAHNVALALAGRKLRRAERRRRALEALDSLGLARHAGAWPGTLSEGELQRVALARALVSDARVFLLDEPFTALDADLRRELLDILLSLKRDQGITFIWVDHRSEEALAMADRLLVIRDGRAEESGPARDVLARPTTDWSARFLVNANILEGEPTGNGRARTALGAFDVTPKDRAHPLFAVSPDAFALDAAGDIQARVETVRFHLHFWAYDVIVGGQSVRCHLKERLAPGRTVRLALVSDPVPVARSSDPRPSEEGGTT